MNFIEQYMLQLNTGKRRWRYAVAILTAMSLLVALVTVWSLRMTGITMANSASCGYEEHLHTDECNQNGCEIAEHIHTMSCYSDLSADVETAKQWEATIPDDLGDDWVENLSRIAVSQVGVTESGKNFILADVGETKQGITRYGQWYGNPYGDWSSLFVMFCLHYAEIPQEAIPWSPGVYNMMRLSQNAQIFRQPDEHIGDESNLLFLDTDKNGNADRVVVVTAYENGKITAIGGDWENAVAEITLSDGDPGIVGYINVGQLQEKWGTQGEMTPDETPDDSDEMSDEPVISMIVEFPAEGILRIVAQISNIEEAMYTWQWQYSEDGQEPWIDIEGATGLVCDLEDTEENFNRFYRLQGQKLTRRFMVRAAGTGSDSATVSDDNTIISAPVTPFSIDKNNRTYTIDVFAIPVDTAGNVITGLTLKELNSFTVTYNSGRVTVKNRFDDDLGDYVSAYFGTAATVSVNNIESVWCSRYYNKGYQYTLAYRQTNGTENDRWLAGANTNVSLYLRYIPKFTVTFASEGFASVTETVQYGKYPMLTAPEAWQRDGYTLLGWTVNGDDRNVYTFEELVKLPITGNVTYTAKWAKEVTVSFSLGTYANDLYAIDPMTIPYGSTIMPLPTPMWKNNVVAMSFDGWYLDEDLSRLVTADYKFHADTILYAKWSPKEVGYYVYFMDFAREGQVPLVLVTYSVTEGQTVSAYVPGNAPAGTGWDGKWYLESNCTNPFNFAIPVSQMEGYLTGANGRDLYLYPGTQDVCRAIFVTYGTKVDPVSVFVGGSIDLDQYRPERQGFEFAGWTLKDGTPVSGVQKLNETTTYYAKWNPGYVSFEAILRIENANDTGMTQAEILGTWYAKAGSHIRVKSTYSGSGNNRTGTHQVVCVVDGKEYPVYTDAALRQQATLNDVYSTYFIYNNTGTTWTDETNWDDVYTGGEVPYSTRPVSSAGDTIINFDYMRIRTDVNFVLSNRYGYLDIFKLYRDGLITGSVTYTSTKPNATGSNVSASGVSGTNMKWTYTAAANSSGSNVYTLLNVKYGQRIYEDYPVGGIWLTVRNEKFYTWICNSTNFTSRREDLSDAFFSGNGRMAAAYQLNADFDDKLQTALMYAIECLPGETADFTINGTDYKVQTHLCEVVNSSGNFSAKELLGCSDGVNPRANQNTKYYTSLNTTSASVGGTSVRTLFGTKYWQYYDKYTGVDALDDIDRAYIFYYDRLTLGISFNFAYDANGNGANETESYEDIAFGIPIAEYQFGAPDYERHPLLNREGYEFAGWLDANGFVLEKEDWESMIATADSENNTMIFIAKWEKISNNIVEYYEDRSSANPFESHYFDNGELLQFPTMTVYPEGWVWQEYGEGQFQRFDWDVPMYGEYGVPEKRIINGEEQAVNVIRIYGTWDESHTKVVYDPNAPQGGVPGTAPTDNNEYTIWQSEVPIASRGETANADSGMIFVGWLLDRNSIVYQPGDHVPVQWPRTMIFTAQWAMPEDVVYLRYDPNGGTPQGIYPNDTGFNYKKNATAVVWDNTRTDGTVWFSRTGYTFIGWNTEPDGSGTAYAPDAAIMLNASVTTLYAQWERNVHTLLLYKIDSENKKPLKGANFELYCYESGAFRLVETLTTGSDGRVSFPELQTAVLYKLVEVRPPDGYATITKEIFFKLTPVNNIISFAFCDSAGNISERPGGVAGEYITGNKMLSLTVENLRGYALPSTGGTGVLLYVLCGLALVLGPLVYGFSLRRRYERRPEG